MSINKQCSKCGKKFTSEYLLDKHLNRKVPCNIILECDICNKIFKEERYLLQHKNKKKSCDPFIKKVYKEKIIYNKVEEIKAKMQYVTVKAKLEEEREQKHHERTLEILDRSGNNKLEIERERTKRKGQNASMINSNNTVAINNNNNNNNNSNNEIHNSFVNHITNKYIFDNKVALNDMRDHIIKYIDTRKKEDYIRMFNENMEFPNIMRQVLTEVYNDKTSPEKRFLYFNDELDKFFAIQYDDISMYGKKVEEIDFKKMILKAADYLVRESFIRLANTMNANRPEDLLDRCKIDQIIYQYHKLDAFPEDIEDCCKDVCNENDK